MDDLYAKYENLSSDDARRIVDEKLTEWKVAYSVRYVGEQNRPEWGAYGKSGKADAFRVSFGNFETDFFMGLGNRELPEAYADRSAQMLIMSAFGEVGGYVAGADHDRKRLAKAKEKLSKPVNPSAADVLYCFLSDASAVDQSFSDWCDAFGYDNDSIKALRTYQACELIGQELRRIFNRNQMAELRAILQNF